MDLLFWDIMCDKELKIPIPNNLNIIGFADYIALITIEKHFSRIYATSSMAVRQIQSCLMLFAHKVPVIIHIHTSERTLIKLAERQGTERQSPEILF